MADLKDIHHIVIGYDRVKEYVINREILRYNFPNGLDMWLTTVYNGGLEKLASGCGENTFITIPENTGYAYGALDAINAGLNFASASYRDIVVLTNFDGFFFNQERYENLIDDFIASGKPFGAGKHQSHEFPMSDLMLFKRDFLKDFLPLKSEVYPPRKEIDFLQNEYEGTQLGFDNVEEWVLNGLYSIGDPNDLWWQFQRDGHPRYRFTEKYAFGHLHEASDVTTMLNKYNIIKGHNITRFLGKEIEHVPLAEIRRPDGTNFSA
tara:strand:- start:54 stop:848 length:795 start_codon:yes stop_codon:yes gene_type:complete